MHFWREACLSPVLSLVYFCPLSASLPVTLSFLHFQRWNTNTSFPTLQTGNSLSGKLSFSWQEAVLLSSNESSSKCRKCYFALSERVMKRQSWKRKLFLLANRQHTWCPHFTSFSLLFTPRMKHLLWRTICSISLPKHQAVWIKSMWGFRALI